MALLLIIDDDEHVRASLDLVLSQQGFTVLQATSLSEGRSQLSKNANIDLVLLDVWLEDGSGLTLLTEVRGSGKDIPIIVISGGGSERSLEKVIAFADLGGAADVLVKPFRNADLLTAVNKVLSA